MKFKTVIFDFDGVLCHEYFYDNLKSSYPEVYKFIQENVFGQDSEIPDQWMKAQLTMDDVNKYISDNTGIDFDELTKLCIEGVEIMKLDHRLLNLAQKLTEQNVKIALVTNNMDVFNTITRAKHNLDKIFPVIVNSFDHGILIHEDNGRLYDIALDQLNTESYDNALLIDDSGKARAIFTSKGGEVFAYESYDQFEPWMKSNLL